jgi:hypothetical protein
MTNEELITVARSHITDMPELTGNIWATSEILPKVSVMDAVIVTFESDQRPGQMFVVLERQTGRFILSGGHPQQKTSN